MPATWRLIDELAGAPGAAQMARDEALLEAAEADGEFPPTLRLYQFKPACLSLGRTQTLASVDERFARSHQLDLVRRPTGGMGVLHHQELTYSFISRIADPFTGSIEQNYTLISEALATGFSAHLKIKCELEPARPDKTDSGACFIVPGLKELKVRGRKLVGSAQRRLRHAFLQHGAIPLKADYALHAGCFRMDAEELRAAMIDLGEAAGKPLDLPAAAWAVTAGCKSRFAVEFRGAPFPAALERRAAELSQTRYATPEWLERAV
jgi:lipoate-protein ligase A